VVSYRMNPPTGRSGDKINPKIRRFVVKDLWSKIRGQIRSQEAEKESKIVGGNGYRAWFIGIAPERP
jgi:hypothetical protein